MGIVVVAVTLAALPAAAGQQGDGQRWHRGTRAHRAHARHVLTQEQREQIRPWLQAEREASKPLRELRTQLREAVLSDSPDQGKIASLQSQLASLTAETLSRRTALAQRIAGLLTPEQRKQLRDSRMLPGFLDPAGWGGRAPFHGPDGRGPRHRPAGPPPPDDQM
jgi:Spy/CpxP family protein refolding chaperone